jgi:hypothetical protein
MSAGLAKLGHVAIDGTKMKANASKHNAMSHERMVKEEVRLKAEVEQLSAAAWNLEASEAAPSSGCRCPSLSTTSSGTSLPGRSRELVPTSVPTFPWRRETPGYALKRSTYWKQ